MNRGHDSWTQIALHRAMIKQANTMPDGSQRPEWMSASRATWCDMQRHQRGWTDEHTIAWLEANGREHMPGVWMIHVRGRDALDAMLR